MTEIDRPVLDGVVVPREPTFAELLDRQAPEMRRFYEKFLAGKPLPPVPPLNDDEHAAISEALIAGLKETPTQ
jgi:hypothetical protein